MASATLATTGGITSPTITVEEGGAEPRPPLANHIEGQDGRSNHRINQYIIKEEIGRAFSAKELVDPSDSPTVPSASDALFFIRQEIAIMKKLNHPNLVQLIEVLDDPEEDSLYMVLEMCKKGVVMKVGLGETATPYPEDSCRYWFRDLILGIEYLVHEQGVIHRDIKPDNLLLTEDDVLKIVDFGVSEMFEKPGDGMMTAKSAGSPAFLAPELCVVRHGDVDGKAADIWSMGVSLYCLRYGKIPFEHDGVLEMYEAIKTESPRLPKDEDPDFVDLMNRILEKDPKKRIPMAELREHAWVTKGGTDLLLSKEDNCAALIELPNELELNRAFTRKMNHLLCVMKAIHKFKTILMRRRQSRNSTLSPRGDGGNELIDQDRDRARAEEIEALIAKRQEFMKKQGGSSGATDKSDATEKAENEPLILGIGIGARDEFDKNEPSAGAVAESPTNVDFNIYDKAYEAEVERIMSKPKRQTTMYLTRFVKDREQFKEVANVIEGTSAAVTPAGTPRFDTHQAAAKGRFADLVSSMTGKGKDAEGEEQ
ncbi:hypothetical protein CBS470a_006596 [Colletotrichum nupharicola]|nr:hypothetical protein CBS470a_006596 [Colletotrichum nupharicola]